MAARWEGTQWDGMGQQMIGGGAIREQRERWANGDNDPIASVAWLLARHRERR